jgi:ribonuclease J
MEEHARLARACGVPETVVPGNGTIIRLAPGPAAIVDHAPSGRLVLDGDVILPADSTTMNIRRKLAWGGLLVVTLVFDPRGRLQGDVRVLARGVPVEDEEEDFIAECAEAAESVARKVPLSDRRRLEDEVKVAVRRVARKWTGKKPLTEVQILLL